MPDESNRSSAHLLGQFAGVLASELGRSVAVVGGLIAGFVSLAKATGEPAITAWPLLAVAGAVFALIAFACRRP